MELALNIVSNDAAVLPACDILSTPVKLPPAIIGDPASPNRLSFPISTKEASQNLFQVAGVRLLRFSVLLGETTV